MRNLCVYLSMLLPPLAPPYKGGGSNHETVGIFSLIIACSLFLELGEATFAQQPIVPIQEQPTIQVVVQTSTWKTRGRLLYDVEGSILKKLSLAGLRTIQDKKKSHQYQLVVQYEEERGAQYGVELWGTIIHASFFFVEPMFQNRSPGRSRKYPPTRYRALHLISMPC